MALAKLPKTFGFSESKKGYFPHFFNKPENQRYVGPIPDVNHYDPDGMKPESRHAFLNWYEEQKRLNVVFNMKKELVEYCRSDVDILRRCCCKFITTVKELCNIHPFEECMTIAKKKTAKLLYFL